MSRLPAGFSVGRLDGGVVRFNDCNITRSEALALIAALRKAVRTAGQARAKMRFGKPVSAKARKASKAAAHKEETEKIREAVFERAKDRCESCGNFESSMAPLVLDHWLGGSGRRRERQSLETTWVLCFWCNKGRTENYPSEAEWNRLWASHCIKHGYDFLPHIEKQILRKGEASR